MAGTSLALIVSRVDGALVLPDKKPFLHTHRIQVPGSTGNAYVVSMRISNKTWECSCRGWIGHRKCWHLAAMLPALKAFVPGSKAADPILRIKG